MQNIIPVILCGGNGTRLWPLSREQYPKQFVDQGDGKTLFSNTLKRAQNISSTNNIPRIICNEAHRFYVTAALDASDMQASIILEADQRNTAPAIALAAFALAEVSDQVMLILPSDHAIEQDEIFIDGIQKGSKLAISGHIVTLGIMPYGPDDGFGYIEQGNPINDTGYHVSNFIEKPSREKAESLLAKGKYYWNSGIFLVKPSVYLEELERHAPKIYDACRVAWENRQEDKIFIRPDQNVLSTCPANSIDYAILEHTEKAAVVPLSIHWQDLGSWEAFYQAGSQDENGNVCTGDVITEDVTDSFFYAGHRLVTAIGVRDLTVVETRDAVLVAQRSRVQEVRGIVASLKKAQRQECEHHPLVHRPWGSYETLFLGPRFQVKRIIVRPGAELSLQMHHHRAEHWVVVSGTAEVTNDEEVKLYTENQSTYIPIGKKHRLKNPGIIPLELVEIQSGSYLGEDDIVRFEDIYGREH